MHTSPVLALATRFGAGASAGRPHLKQGGGAARSPPYSAGMAARARTQSGAAGSARVCKPARRAPSGKRPAGTQGWRWSVAALGARHAQRMQSARPWLSSLKTGFLFLHRAWRFTVWLFEVFNRYVWSELLGACERMQKSIPSR